ncbi:serine protease [Pseudomonas kairouanensis]|uniref:Serine protease n=1 Tax=Pseudomonas kairouanensis TaxID=2293832 RepID=A0A4Z0ASM7_9PSED|nr:trypsin-like peptidase domain-containing protein [Pseudomonas kairouanensis]TFY88968.1 serine protease [Pseudomonas kairouanensis]
MKEPSALTAPRFRPDFMIQSNNGGRLEPVADFNASRVMAQQFRRRLLPARLRQESLRDYSSHGIAFAQSFFGNDDRTPTPSTTALPWRCICQLVVEGVHPGRQLLGTGWLAGPHTVITAGHNLFNPETNNGATRITVVPGRDGDVAPFDYYVAGDFRVHQGWYESGNQHQDVGVVWLQKPLGKRLGWFGIASYSDKDLVDLIVNTAGYPADKRIGTQWFNAGRIDSVDADTLYYGLDTQPGQSGSPVFQFDAQSRRVALAVHAYGADDRNQGIRINDEIYDLFSSWIR